MKRDIEIKLRVNQEEKDFINRCMQYVGIKSRNAYLVKLIRGVKFFPAKEIAETNELFSQIVRVYAGIGNNLNQLTKIANATDSLPEKERLEDIRKEVMLYKTELAKLWERLRRMLYGST